MAINTNTGPISKKIQATMPGGELFVGIKGVPNFRHYIGVTGDITESIEASTVSIVQHEQVGGVKTWFEMETSTTKTLELTVKAMTDISLKLLYGGEILTIPQVAGTVVSEAGLTDGTTQYALGLTSNGAGVTCVNDVVVTNVGAAKTYVEGKDYHLLNRIDGFAQIVFIEGGDVHVAALAAPSRKVPFEVSYKTTAKTIKLIKTNTIKSPELEFYFDGVDAISKTPISRIFEGSVVVNGSYTIKSLGEEITEVPLTISVSPMTDGSLGIIKMVENK